MKIPELRRLLAAYFDAEQFEIEQVIARLTPVLLIDDISPETGEAKLGPRWAMGQSDNAASAAEYGISHLQNPAGSGIRCEVFDCWYSIPAAGVATIGFYNTAAAGSSPERLINRYYGSLLTPGVPTCKVTEETNAAIGIQASDHLFRQYCQANGTVHVRFDGALVLAPGCGIRCVDVTVNQQFNVSWRWREVPEA